MQKGLLPHTPTPQKSCHVNAANVYSRSRQSNFYTRVFWRGHCAAHKQKALPTLGQCFLQHRFLLEITNFSGTKASAACAIRKTVGGAVSLKG